MSLSTGLDRLSFKQSLTTDECQWLTSELDGLGDDYWQLRTEMHRRRAIASVECNYRVCGNERLPPHIYQFLIDRSPCPTETIGEVVVNKYAIGDWIPEHRDRHPYRQFVVVPLQSKGDGLFVEDKWFEDTAGMGLLFEGISHRHSVPPLKHARYVVVYIYE